MRKSLSGGLALLAAPFLLVTTTPAQISQQQANAAGLGAQKLVVDVGTPTSNVLMLGVVHLGGEYFVTGSAIAPATVGEVYVFDSAGNFVRQFPQGPNATTAFGYRDGATDGVSLMFGYENGIEVMDINGNPVTTVIAANGPQTIVNPIAGAGLALNGTYRAVAYDPNGNGGNGSIWTGDFGDPLLEIDLAGNILNNFPNTAGWSIYGLARDPVTGTLWANSIPNAGNIAEIDPTTGMPTGVSFVRNQPNSAQGGLSPVGANDLVGLDQGTPDSITLYRNHLYPAAILGKNEPRLLTEVDGAGLNDTQFKIFRGGSMVAWQITQGGVPTLFPALIAFNFAGDSQINGTTAFFPGGPPIPEFVALSGASSPTGFALYSSVLSTGVTLGRVPMGFLNDGDPARLQALAFLPGVGLLASNQQVLLYDGSALTVSASGTNSFNADPTSGFFSVRHNSGPAITDVRFDWVASSNPNQSTMEFDCDQTGMADVFWGGNSTVAGCLGTYRNGSDVTTGLIYQAGQLVPSCDPLALSGFVGTNQVGTTGADYRTLDFAFTPGSFQNAVFEFDSDTDGGQGVTGADMAGMVVTITLADGTIRSGELAADPNDPQRSFIKFF